MRAEIICIGTELLLGQIVDTNAAFLARELADLGIDLFYKSTVGDNLDRVVATLGQAWGRADLLILSGGLGPTQDDLTREAVAAILGEDLEFNEAAWEEVGAYFNKIQRVLPSSNRRQAMFPKSATIIKNNLGTAPGVLVDKDGHYLVAMPGVPSELVGMWQNEVRPFLEGVLAKVENSVLSSRMIRMVGIGESAMEEEILDLIKDQTNPTIAPYAGRGEVHLRVTAKSPDPLVNLSLIEQTTDLIKQRLGAYIYGYDQDNLETVVGRLLKDRGWHLATAESCTSGLIAHRITNVAGSSAYFWGGVNSYSNQSKLDWLGVSASTLASEGAVSSETAKADGDGNQRTFRG